MTPFNLWYANYMSQRLSIARHGGYWLRVRRGNWLTGRKPVWRFTDKITA